MNQNDTQNAENSLNIPIDGSRSFRSSEISSLSGTATQESFGIKEVSVLLFYN